MTPDYYQEKKTIKYVIFTFNTFLLPGQITHADIEGFGDAQIFHKVKSEGEEVLLVPFPSKAPEDGSGREGAEKEGYSIHEGLSEDSHSFRVYSEDPSENPKSLFGVTAKVKEIFDIPGTPGKVILEGVNRARVNDLVDDSPRRGQLVEYIYQEDAMQADQDLEDRMTLLSETAMSYLSQVNSNFPATFFFSKMMNSDPDYLTNNLTDALNLDWETKRKILAELDIKARVDLLITAIDKMRRVQTLNQEINKTANARVQSQQNEYLLREQLKVIREELGDKTDDPSSLADEYEEAIQALPMPKESKDQVMREVDRMRYISPMSPEINVSRGYLDTILDLPWGKYTEDNTNLDQVKRILDRDHYGLKEVKERILEFLSVRKIRSEQEDPAGTGKGSILCLVGPPGVGKTSIARSIARAMNRKFTTMRLGGITDESEIRGHRKTYVGSMPGRIISQMIRVESMNPVFLFDELDKIGKDYRGDPASALLEVLDPEQNHFFQDRYLEIPFDLSQVFFLATANTIDTIPAPLKDRMEIIRIPGYTDEEKLQIGRRFLVKKQRDEAGLTGNQVRINQGVVEKIIRYYTREAGVRELERQIGKTFRVSAKKLVEGEDYVSVTTSNLKEFLGEPKYLDEDYLRKPELGTVNGLAWTQVGGVILNIEANIMEGRGKLILTGSLGDVMKESAELAISYIRANAKRFGLDPGMIQWVDIHIHMPEGAVPKDGPSAGVSILTAVLSALTKRPVDSNYAMTGEITLTGRVLPVGGIKEKVLAARRYGISKIMIPKANMRDLKDLDEDLVKSLEFIPLEHVDQVVERVLLGPVEDKKDLVFRREGKEPMGFRSDPGSGEKS